MSLKELYDGDCREHEALFQKYVQVVYVLQAFLFQAIGKITTGIQKILKSLITKHCLKNTNKK